MTQIWGPVTIRISGDESVAGEIRPTEGGGVQFNFPERLVMIANHQVRSPGARQRRRQSLKHSHMQSHSYENTWFRLSFLRDFSQH